MALHLVGESIDKTRSHYLAEAGKIIQLMRGIYVDAGDDIEQTVLTHAVRIARLSLRPLGMPSAVLAAQHGGSLSWLRAGTCVVAARRPPVSSVEPPDAVDSR